MQNFHITIGVLGLPIRQKKGSLEFLLTKRHSPLKPIFHDKWQLAGGGMHFGETPEDTLLREMQEELGILVEIIHPQPIVKTNTWEKGDDEFDHSVHIVLITYLVSIGTQEPTILDPDEETSDVNWFTFRQIMELESLPKTKDFVVQAQQIIDRHPFNMNTGRLIDLP